MRLFLYVSNNNLLNENNLLAVKLKD